MALFLITYLQNLKFLSIFTYFQKNNKHYRKSDNAYIVVISAIYTTLICGCTLKPFCEQKARATYEKIIDLCRDNPDVLDPLKFLRQREIVHFQRFGEALRGVQDKLAEKKCYMN